MFVLSSDVCSECRAAGMKNSIEILGLRLQGIEDKLFGPGEDGQSELKWNERGNVVNTLVEVDTKLKSLTIGKDRFSQCHNELSQLQHKIGSDRELQSMWSGDNPEATQVAFEEVLAFEEQILADSTWVERIETLEPSMDSPHIRGVPDLQSKLCSLKMNLLQLRKASLDMEDEIHVMCEQYIAWLRDTEHLLGQFNSDLEKLEATQAECD